MRFQQSYAVSQSRRMLWSVVSKAADRSNRERMETQHETARGRDARTMTEVGIKCRNVWK